MKVIIRTETGAICTGRTIVATVGAIVTVQVVDQLGIPFEVSGQAIEVL